MEPREHFETWRRSFELKLMDRRQARKAFEAWQQHVRDLRKFAQRIPSFKKLPGDPYILPRDTGPKTYVLKKLYYWTRPLDVGSGRLPKKLLRDIDKFTKLLEKRSKQFLNEYVNEPYSLEGYDDDDQWLVAELFLFYRRTARVSRAAYSFLSHSYQRQPDLLDQCLPLIARLKYVVKVREREILALVKLALEANGHTQGLASFDPSPTSVDRGTVRNRLSRRISEYATRQKLLTQLIANLRTR
jgi:hypothetical protein